MSRLKLVVRRILDSNQVGCRQIMNSLVSLLLLMDVKPDKEFQVDALSFSKSFMESKVCQETRLNTIQSTMPGTLRSPNKSKGS